MMPEVVADFLQRQALSQEVSRARVAEHVRALMGKFQSQRMQPASKN